MAVKRQTVVWAWMDGLPVEWDVECVVVSIRQSGATWSQFMLVSGE